MVIISALLTKKTEKNTACLLDSTMEQFPIDGTIEDFRFLFLINPAAALTLNLPTISIRIGN
jgi:hypothetical protein